MPIEEEDQILFCYKCKKAVALDELQGVDELIENLDEEKAELIADEFVHCLGSPNLFHDEGIVNCCRSCYDEIFL